VGFSGEDVVEPSIELLNVGRFDAIAVELGAVGAKLTRELAKQALGFADLDAALLANFNAVPLANDDTLIDPGLFKGGDVRHTLLLLVGITLLTEVGLECCG